MITLTVNAAAKVKGILEQEKESLPQGGLRITIPPHEGKATLLFTVHNRQTLTPEAPKKDAPPTYARYTATLRVLAPNGSEVQASMQSWIFRRSSMEIRFERRPCLRLSQTNSDEPPPISKIKA